MPGDTSAAAAKSGHTPGPWSTRQQFSNRWLIEKDQGCNEEGDRLVPLGLAAVQTTILEVGCGNANTAANACLIAAAPALLEALEKDAARLLRIREKLAGWDAMSGTQRADYANWIWHAECETRAAIAAATGAEVPS